MMPGPAHSASTEPRWPRSTRTSSRLLACHTRTVESVEALNTYGPHTASAVMLPQWHASGAEAKAGACAVPTITRMVSEEGPPHACTRPSVPGWPEAGPQGRSRGVPRSSWGSIVRSGSTPLAQPSTGAPRAALSSARR